MRKYLILLLLPLIFFACQGGYRSTDPYPYGPGVYHVVRKGQTLYSIAKAYGKNVNTLSRLNGIRDTASMQAGRRLWIPGARRVINVPPTDKSVITAHKKKPRYAVKPRKGKLKWPAKGKLTSNFGYRRGRHHDGIDIAASMGTPIYAAAGGKVVFSGWGPTGYGQMIIIKHPGQLTTVYAHNLGNWVKKNDRVKQGQKIASIGSSGRSSGPHLHFEVRRQTVPVSPFKFLSHQRRVASSKTSNMRNL